MAAEPSVTTQDMACTEHAQSALYTLTSAPMNFLLSWSLSVRLCTIFNYVNIECFINYDSIGCFIMVDKKCKLIARA